MPLDYWPLDYWPLDYWPLRNLRLRTPDLLLRPMVEADLQVMADTLPSDVGQDPSQPTFPALDRRLQRGVGLHQGYWRSLGTWSPDAWRLTFVVIAGERLIGAQELEGNDFAVLRTVDSSSHLAADVRGRGWGKQMRRAVLALAFGPLDAQLAVTSAWQHNAASLGVSRSIGYVDNGISRHRRDDGEGSDTMVHLRLARETWDTSGQAADVTITGFEPCRSYFGI